MNRILLLLTFLLFLNYTAKTQDSVDANFTAGNTAFEQKKYANAIKSYEAILATGTHSAELFYNLGNSYYQQGNIGKAILNYEKSLSLKSSDDTRFNLEIAKSKQIDQLSTIGATPKQLWGNMVKSFSATGWTILMVLLFWATIGAWILWLIGKERIHRKRGFLIGVIGIPLVLFVGVLASSRNDLQKDSRRAILISEEIDLRISPDPKGESLKTLHEGVELNLIEEINDWYHVRLINGDQGWLPESSFERI